MSKKRDHEASAPVETFNEIRDAWKEVSAARDEAVTLGQHANPGPRFWDAFDTLCLAIHAACVAATPQALRRLVQVVTEIQKAIGARRDIFAAGDPICSVLWWRGMDLLGAAIDGLQRISRPPVIESPVQIAKGLNKPGDPEDRWLNHIHNAWPHVPTVELISILYGQAPDLDPTDHPDVIAWHREQQKRPLVNLGVLYGYVAEIEYARQQDAAVA